MLLYIFQRTEDGTPKKKKNEHHILFVFGLHICEWCICFYGSRIIVFERGLKNVDYKSLNFVKKHVSFFLHFSSTFLHTGNILKYHSS